MTDRGDRWLAADAGELRPAAILRLWFGVEAPVSRTAYAVSGALLMALKYAVEALAVWTFTGRVFLPWDFLDPVLSDRIELLQPAPEWLAWGMFLWSLPFLWICVSMSVRRAADTGLSPWFGLWVLVPLANLAFMLLLCAMPHGGQGPRNVDAEAANTAASSRGSAPSAALAVGLSILVGGFMLWVSVYLFATYGASLFFGTPLLMGATAAYLDNRWHPGSFRRALGLGLLSVLFAELALLLFALEGVICLAMAAPLILPVGAMGGLIGKMIADATQRPPSELAAALVVLPLVAGGEALLVAPGENVVLTVVEVDAPPAIVWENVVGFPELTAKPAWYFAWGIACPVRATIEGQGIGATRFCEFTTGTFVEPITAWEHPSRLAFDVTHQPPALIELSPYRHVHPPHFSGYLTSKRGEFRLSELPGGRTRLEGRTWYTFAMYPERYWTLWSDTLIHRIHGRVLEHIKQVSEASVGANAGGALSRLESRR
jgi:uncharacterized membrane protein YhaH (DUF805 family)